MVLHTNMAVQTVSEWLRNVALPHYYPSITSFLAYSPTLPHVLPLTSKSPVNPLVHILKKFLNILRTYEASHNLNSNTLLL